MGAYKMFVMLKDIFLDVMPGRDKFYKITPVRDKNSS